MLSNLKAFFAERDIDITDIIQTIKNNKRATSFIGDRSDDQQERAFW